MMDLPVRYFICEDCLRIHDIPHEPKSADNTAFGKCCICKQTKWSLKDDFAFHQRHPRLVRSVKYILAAFVAGALILLARYGWKSE